MRQTRPKALLDNRFFSFLVAFKNLVRSREFECLRGCSNHLYLVYELTFSAQSIRHLEVHSKSA